MKSFVVSAVHGPRASGGGHLWRFRVEPQWGPGAKPLVLGQRDEAP